MRFLLVLPLALIATACAHKHAATPAADPAVTAANAPAATPSTTKATFMAAPKSKVAGDIAFTPENNQLHVILNVSGLKPGSKHGIHVHENGECTPPKFESAGGHYNPSNVGHGDVNSPQRHPGDLGNLIADKKGNAHLDLMIPQSPSADSFAGRAVVIHAKADDLKSQPSGNSGDRLACAVLKAE